MQEYEQTRSGIYLPRDPESDEQAVGMVGSPMMQYLMLNVLNSWAFDEEHWKAAWNSPVYGQLALISDVTMQGITLIQRADHITQSKGWAGLCITSATCIKSRHLASIVRISTISRNPRSAKRGQGDDRKSKAPSNRSRGFQAGRGWFIFEGFPFARLSACRSGVCFLTGALTSPVNLWSQRPAMLFVWMAVAWLFRRLSRID